MTTETKEDVKPEKTAAEKVAFAVKKIGKVLEELPEKDRPRVLTALSIIYDVEKPPAI